MLTILWDNDGVLVDTEGLYFQATRDVLRSLYGQVRMGVVTSARRVHFEAAHAGTDLRRYLDFELTREDYQQSKPHPEPYLTALGRHRLRPEDCIVVEDSERGRPASCHWPARAFGMDTDPITRVSSRALNQTSRTSKKARSCALGAS